MNRYSLRKDPKDTHWIALPNNGGEVGDMSDITCELNRLLGNYEVAVDERDTAIAERDKAREKLSEWSILTAWGGTPEIIHEFIKGQQNRIHYAQNLEEELFAAIAERDVLLQAIRNLRDTKGRYHTQQAFESLMTLLPTNQND